MTCGFGILVQSLSAKWLLTLWLLTVLEDTLATKITHAHQWYYSSIKRTGLLFRVQLPNIAQYSAIVYDKDAASFVVLWSCSPEEIKT